jgi:hypothetical protein
MKYGTVLLQNFIRRMINEWMTNFYGEDWFNISSLDHPMTKPGIYELSLAEKDHDKFSEAQRLGFELVETQVGFKTKIEEVNLVDTDSHYVRMAKDSDLEEILHITTKCFLDNPKFTSRFKNKNFFTKEHFIKYYNLSITNYFSKKNSYTSVVEKEGKVVGYYMIIDEGDNCYRGIMTGVLPEERGKGLHITLQNKCFKEFDLPFYTINRTQINNLNVLNSHIKEKRKLTDIKFIFLKRISYAN